ncbi:MAG: CHAP domain-containing protein [Oscillospiraceae bacterium]|nr:CHAP domain-containing protein [Oscillospiraceae bacterium]
MSINGTTGINSPIYDGTNSANGIGNNNGGENAAVNTQESNIDFSGVLSDALQEQAMQSLMNKMAGSASGFGNSGGFGSTGGMDAMFGGTNAMLGLTGGLGGLGGPGAMTGMMPSISSGLENTLVSAAGTGEMSGVQLMLFMLIMMMQTGDSNNSEMMAPIMQMIAGMLQQTTNTTPAPAPVPNNMAMLENMQDGSDSDLRRMVDAALEEVGYREKNADGSFGRGNRTKFGAWYGMDGQPWCAMFVSWAADQAGILNSTVPKHASTSLGVNAYRDKGLYAVRSSGYMPKEGDAIYFQSSEGRIRHVGIVVGVDPQTQKVYTVEGNTSDAVRIRHYDLNSTRIHGYGQNGGTGYGRIPVDSTEGAGASDR